MKAKISRVIWMMMLTIVKMRIFNCSQVMFWRVSELALQRYFSGRQSPVFRNLSRVATWGPDLDVIDRLMKNMAVRRQVNTHGKMILKKRRQHPSSPFAMQQRSMIKETIK